MQGKSEPGLWHVSCLGGPHHSVQKTLADVQEYGSRFGGLAEMCYAPNPMVKLEVHRVSYGSYGMYGNYGISIVFTPTR